MTLSDIVKYGEIETGDLDVMCFTGTGKIIFGDDQAALELEQVTRNYQSMGYEISITLEYFKNVYFVNVIANHKKYGTASTLWRTTLASTKSAGHFFSSEQPNLANPNYERYVAEFARGIDDGRR